MSKEALNTAELLEKTIKNLDEEYKNSFKAIEDLLTDTHQKMTEYLQEFVDKTDKILENQQKRTAINEIAIEDKMTRIISILENELAESESIADTLTLIAYNNREMMEAVLKEPGKYKETDSAENNANIVRLEAYLKDVYEKCETVEDLLIKTEKVQKENGQKGVTS